MITRNPRARAVISPEKTLHSPRRDLDEGVSVEIVRRILHVAVYPFPEGYSAANLSAWTEVGVAAARVTKTKTKPGLCFTKGARDGRRALVHPFMRCSPARLIAPAFCPCVSLPRVCWCAQSPESCEMHTRETLAKIHVRHSRIEFDVLSSGMVVHCTVFGKRSRWQDSPLEN